MKVIILRDKNKKNKSGKIKSRSTKTNSTRTRDTGYRTTDSRYQDRSGDTGMYPPYTARPDQTGKKPSKKKSRKKQRRASTGKEYVIIAYLCVGMFLSLIGYMVYFNVKLKDDVISSPYNRRQDTYAEHVVRGEIQASGGEVLAKMCIRDSCRAGYPGSGHRGRFRNHWGCLRTVSSSARISEPDTTGKDGYRKGVSPPGAGTIKKGCFSSGFGYNKYRYTILHLEEMPAMSAKNTTQVIIGGKRCV